jgi:hypothetical protein
MTETAWKRVQRLRKELYEAEAKLPRCAAVIHVGNGHQSTRHCGVLGPHKQHNSGNEFFWSKKEAFSGYFNESPEEPE